MVDKWETKMVGWLAIIFLFFCTLKNYFPISNGRWMRDKNGGMTSNKKCLVVINDQLMLIDCGRY